jgi:subtilisin family serine protease
MKRQIFTPRNLTLVALILIFSTLIVGGTRASAETPALIRLQYAAFDPLQGEPFIPAPLQSTREHTGGTGAGTYLLQFNGPVREEWKTQVEAAGARLYGYVPEHAFIARLDGDALQAVKRLASVRWVGPYRPAYRVAPSLRSRLLAPQEAEVSLSVETLPDADLDELAARIRAWGGRALDRTANDFSGYLEVALSEDRISDLAALEGVIWVEPKLEVKLLNDVATGDIMHTDSVSAALGLDGSGQVVGVADSGLDTGDMNTLHPDIKGRVTAAYCLGRPDPCDWSDFIGHGTHVAGSIMGNGYVSGGKFAGAAPGASLVMQSIADATGALVPINIYELLDQAYTDGARVHSDSWGGASGGPTNPYGGYTSSSSQVDNVMWQKPDLLVLFAAGNNGVDVDPQDGLVDSDSINQPGTAKNVLTVGASESYRPNIGSSWSSSYGEPIASDYVSDDTSGMAAFSSRGPTDDGRIKPDLVAPGTFIASTRTSIAEGIGWANLSDVDLAQPGDALDQAYVMNGGTSMATPLAAGAAALTRQWLVEKRGLSSPSGALMKAVLINGAVDISPGQYASPQEIPDQRPNNVSGWGRLDLAASLNPPSPRQVWLKDNQTGLGAGGVATYTLNVVPAGAGGLAYEESVSAAEPPSLEIQSGPPQLTLLDEEPLHSPSAIQEDLQLIQNGGFETTGSWTTMTTTRSTAKSLSGSWSMASTPGSDGYFYQTVAIPSDAISATLKYYWSNDPSDQGNDLHQVQIYDENFLNAIGAGPALSDSDTGWGGVSLGFDPIMDQVKGKTIQVVFYIDQNDTDPKAKFYFDQVSLSVKTPTPPPVATGPLRLTLAWTDYPGSAYASPALVNDLDLEVIAPDGAHYYGNSGLYTSGGCLRDGKWDACNNVEGVYLPSALSGQYTVVVHGSDVPQGPQPFALVASGDNLLNPSGPLQPVFLPLIRH